MAEKGKVGFFRSKGFLMLVVIFLFVLVLSFFFGDSGIIEIIRTQKQIDSLKQEIIELEKTRDELKREIKELKENPVALERKAREKLWLMKKNERVVVFVDENKNKKESPKKPDSKK